MEQIETSLEAVHTCTVNPLLSPTLKRNPCWEKKVIKHTHPHPPLPLSSLIFLSGRLYYLITIVTLHVDLSGMVYSPSGSSDLFLQFVFTVEALFRGHPRESYLCTLPLHDVQLHLPERFHFAFYTVMEN